jgi:predicted nucleotidyltransferase
MNATLLNLSNRHELEYLAALTAVFKTAACDIPFFLAGATARDLLLEHAHGIKTGRKTEDVDLALMVPDWASFMEVRSQLLATSRFSAAGVAIQALKFDGFLSVDLIPFGAIERGDRTVAWPPNGDVVMSVLGFREVFDSTIRARLPDDIDIQVVSLPVLAVLKLFAWADRRLGQPRKDAYDLSLILANYLSAGNQERLYSEAAHLLDLPDFDFESAGVRLLGRDMALLISGASRLTLAALLQKESDAIGFALLALDMPIDTNHALTLIQSMAGGFHEIAGK